MATSGGVARKGLALERADEVATIWLNRSERRNAIDLAWATELDELTALCAADPGVHVIVLRADGDAFSVGGEIDAFAAAGDSIEAYVLEITHRFHRAIDRLATGPAVSVAIIEGAAAGAGFSLALACDLIIAGPRARFVAGWSRIGLSPDGGASRFLAERLGPRRAFEILALNPALDAAEAQRLGLVARIAPAEGPDGVLQDLLSALRAATPGSLAQIKALIAEAPAGDLRTHLQAERRAIARLAATAEARGRFEQFLNRRAQDAGPA